VVDARQPRVGVNEALFRAVNERIEDINEAFATVTETFEIVCECGDPECMAQISIARDAYERVRADATFFIVAPGHEKLDIEGIVEKHDDYLVVRKHPGPPQRIAEQTDPRR
jgi:hypothetical protein